MIRSLLKFTILLCLAAAAGDVMAQADPPPTPKPSSKAKEAKGAKDKEWKAEPTPPVKPKHKSDYPPVAPPAYPRYTRDERFTSEKAIAADPNVAVKLCVAEGSIKINGTERNEVRVFVRNGRKFEFKSLEKNPETGKPNWVWITNVSAPAARRGQTSNCLAGDSVEIDMPVNASINLEARTAGAVIDSIKKATVKIVEGSIGLRNIPNGVSAVALQGDVSVESSGGAIAVETTTGNIMAFDVRPGQIGDLLKARTNSGNISLQQVNHRQIEANSITGSVSFNGKFLTGGIYNFKTSNGSIRLLLPHDTSCQIRASYGFGTFNSSIPIKIITENVTSGGKSFVASLGSDNTTTLSVTTTSGSIGIRKQN